MDSLHPSAGTLGAWRPRTVSQAKRAFSTAPGDSHLARTIRPLKLTIFCAKTKGIPGPASLGKEVGEEQS